MEELIASEFVLDFLDDFWTSQSGLPPIYSTLIVNKNTMSSIHNTPLST